jgi:hypothetical protein
VPFRKPEDPEALARWRAVQRALKAQRKAAAKEDPRLLALKKAAKERQHAAYERARERNRAALAEAKKRQREAMRKAKEAIAVQRSAALLRKLVRPATVAAEEPTVAAALAARQVADSVARERATARKPKAGASKVSPAQLVFAALTSKTE